MSKSNNKNTPNKTIKKKINTKEKTWEDFTLREQTFVLKYIELGNGGEAVKQAGYVTKAPWQYANNLLRKVYIRNEIDRRVKEMHKKNVASAQDVMEFFTRCMNGEEKDQFGLDISASDKIKAAVELAKRTIDIENRVKEQDKTITLKVDWQRD